LGWQLRATSSASSLIPDFMLGKRSPAPADGLRGVGKDWPLKESR
jgi:hypothetical protein